MKYFRRGQGTFLHLIPAETSQGNTWSSRAGLELLCWPEIAKARPAIFSSVPHRKIDWQGPQLQSILASERPDAQMVGEGQTLWANTPCVLGVGLALQRL